MIEGIVGLPGNGKTIFAVSRMLQAGKEKPVFANFHCKTRPKRWEFAIWPDMVEKDNCMCVIDEAQMWFGSRNWRKNTQAELAVFQQHRKQGMDLLWICQHENRVDTALKELTAFYWRVRNLGNWILAVKVSPDEPKIVLARRVFLASPRLWQHYHTEEIIGLRDGDGYRLGKGKLYASADGLTAEEERNFNGVSYCRIEHMGMVKYIPRNDLRLLDEIQLAKSSSQGSENAVVEEVFLRSFEEVNQV